MTVELTDFFGGLGNIITIVFFFLPLTIILELCKTKDTSKITWLLFIFTILNCEFWMIYGIKLNAWPIYFCNGVGVATNSLYITAYLLYLKEPLWRRIFLIFLFFFIFFSTFFVFLRYVQNIHTIGWIALVMNMFMYAAPLQKISDVYKFHDNSYINIWIGLCLALNSSVWFTYGFFKSRDAFIMVPNMFGFFLNIFQIYLWNKFRKSPDSKMKNHKKFYDYEVPTEGSHEDVKEKEEKENHYKTKEEELDL